jgi:hypothetical protein
MDEIWNLGCNLVACKANEVHPCVQAVLTYPTTNSATDKQANQ